MAAPVEFVDRTVRAKADDRAADDRLVQMKRQHEQHIREIVAQLQAVSRSTPSRQNAERRSRPYRNLIFWNLGGGAALPCASKARSTISSFRTIVTEDKGDEISLTRFHFRAYGHLAVWPLSRTRELDDL